MPTPFILTDAESRPNGRYDLMGHPVLLKLRSADTLGELSLFSGEYRQGQRVPLHAQAVDETVYGLAGEFLFQAGDQRFTATTGDTVFIPRHQPHTYLTLSASGKRLFLVNPAANMALFFQQLSLFKGPPSPEELAQVAALTAIDLLGPPLTRSA